MTNSASAPARARPPRPTRGRPPARDGPSARDGLLDATERLMLDEGYAAVSTRRVAAMAGTDKALVHYYFGTMDDLFIALFRRNAETRAAKLGAALTASQPLWALWDTLHDRSTTRLMAEFVALANHRKAVKTVMADNSRKFRRMQMARLAEALDGYGVDVHEWSPSAVIMLLSAISRHVRTDEEFGVGLGRDDLVRLVENHITGLEGPRLAHPKRS